MGDRNNSKTDLKKNSATLHLRHLKDWNVQQLKDLIDGSQKSADPANKVVPRLRDNLQSSLKSHIFHNMPIRVMKLPEMELMDRGAVLSYLIKTQVGTSNPSMQDRAISEWARKLARFAILSHTWWQATEEPTYGGFNEQRERSGTGKPTLKGYKKLETFCDIAYREYGIEFAWADTVCIDKSSSTELDESIRSMFAWYRNSDVCIAYLGDTNDLLDCSSDPWFTRGWTLQEILAPHRLKFYTKDWHQLTSFQNDKMVHLKEPHLNSHLFHLLHHAVYRATKIEMTAICHFQPGIWSPSLPERMTWVARRNTTRPEDKAYCMMGVFGVSISTAYGEGAERAFFRLFSAILKVGYSRDWFIWGGKPIPRQIHPSRMIPSSPKCYLSRDNFGNADLMLMNARDGEPLALTNVGLPMKMLIVPARISYGPDQSTYRIADIHISCILSDEPVVVQGQAFRWNGGVPSLMVAAQFALGFLNIVEPEVVDAPKHLYAILLRRPVQELSRTTVIDWVAPKWEKWETNEALVLRCSERFERMGADVWNETNISRSDVGWPEGGDDPRIRLQTLYL